jgi:phosphoribosylformylglycinamidine (FGAM) synthase PurS component
MTKNRVIIVRVTKAQYERIINNAEAKGHRTISDYIRSSVLGFDMVTETRIQRIFEVVVGGNEETPKRHMERAVEETLEV